MNLNFAAQLDQGAQAAEVTLASREEIAQTFEGFRHSIAEFLEIEVVLSDEAEFEAGRMTEARMFGPEKPTGYKLLFIKSTKLTVKKELFKYKEDPDGYPITINYLHQRYICNSQAELVEALGMVVADSQIHLVFKAFKNEYAALADKG